MDSGPADVNWLLSAIAQSSAALIAIVGGLLVSRYVTLHAEQQGARRRADDLARRAEEARDHLADAERAFDLYYVDDFLDDDDVFRAILREQGEASVDDALAAKDSDWEGLHRTLLEERFNDLQREFVSAVQTLLPLVPEGKDHAEWLDFKRGRELEIGHRRIWEWTYSGIVDDRVKAARRAEREARRKSPYAPLFPEVSPIDLIPNSVRGLGSVVASQHEIAEVNVLRGRVETARAEVRVLEQEHRLAEETFEATRQPEGFNLALQVLSVLAVLGMAVPVVVMAFVPFSLPGLARGAVVGVFFVGVALLLRFLFAYASYLTGARRSLPVGVLGLFRRGARHEGSQHQGAGSIDSQPVNLDR